MKRRKKNSDTYIGVLILILCVAKESTLLTQINQAQIKSGKKNRI